VFPLLSHVASFSPRVPTPAKTYTCENISHTHEPESRTMHIKQVIISGFRSWVSF
jgi:hypothetical protein